MLFLPLYDDNPTRRTPVVTIAIIAICVLVYLWQFSLGERAGQAAIYALGVVPAVLFGQADLPPELATVPPWATVVTSMFLHGGFLHLGGNMLFLWIFGNNVEDSMGRVRFILFYLLCGTVAALAQSFQDTDSTIPMVGASGAIGGVLGAYIILHPRANVRCLLWIIIFVTMINVPAMVVLGFWFAGQVLSGVATPTSDEGGVAFWAHVGGFVAGAALILFFRRRGVTLMQPAHSKAFQTMPAVEAIREENRRRGSVPSVPRGRSPWG